jgi:hypothetical protein
MMDASLFRKNGKTQLQNGAFIRELIEQLGFSRDEFYSMGPILNRYKLIENGLFATCTRETAADVIWDSLLKMSPIRGELLVLGRDKYDLDRSLIRLGFKEPNLVHTARPGFLRFIDGPRCRRTSLGKAEDKPCAVSLLLFSLS